MKESNVKENILNTIISEGYNVVSNKLHRITLQQAFDKIKTYSPEMELNLIRIREEQEEKKQQALKKALLPYFILGTFRNDQRGNLYFESSEFMLFDFDHLIDVDGFRRKLIADPRVFALFSSPRKNLKVIFRLSESIADYKVFRKLYQEYKKNIKQEFGLEGDKTSSPAWACFYSYDADLYLNLNALPLDVSIKEGLELLDAEDFIDDDNDSQVVTGKGILVDFTQVREENRHKLSAAVDFLRDNVKLERNEE